MKKKRREDKPALAPQGALEWLRRPWVQALALVVAVLLAFSPGYEGAFIWDDAIHLTENPMVLERGGLWQAWFAPVGLLDYYPLVGTTFWLEYRLWGLDPYPYHVTNALLHAGGAAVLFFVLRRLGLRAAWVAAAVWALHPVQVESVTWVAERKNVLSGALFFAAVLSYLKFAGIGDDLAGTTPRRWAWYAAAAVLFVLAMLSKTVTCVLPVVLLVVLWWKRGRLTRTDVGPVAALLPLAAGLAAVGVYFQRYHAAAMGAEFEFTLVERVLIAGRAVWFYLLKQLWPYPLLQVYPRFAVHPPAWMWAAPAAVAGAVAALWALRAKIGRGPVAAALCFLLIIGPALGFISYYTMLFTFVADHYQYLAMAASLPALVEAARWALARTGRPAWTIGAATLVLAMLASLTLAQARLYVSEVGLWKYNADHNPGSFVVQANLGSAVVKEADRLGTADPAQATALENAAEVLFRRAIALKPDDERAYARLAAIYNKRGDVARFREVYEKLEANVPIRRPGEENIPLFGGAAIRARGGDAEFFAGTIHQRRGELREALTCYEKNLARFPRHVPALNGAGACKLALGDLQGAQAMFEQALAVESDNTGAMLGMAQIAQARGDEAEARKWLERSRGK